MCSWSKSWDAPKSDGAWKSGPQTISNNSVMAEPLIAPSAVPSNPWDALNQDDLLMLHKAKQDTLAALKVEELELRKYIVNRAFPNKTEGMNTVELGQGYELKATVKYNYRLADNDTVESGLDKIAKLGNEGPFIADRLIGWTPNFYVSEYREIQKAADAGNPNAKEMLKVVEGFLTITDAAPTLVIKEPKIKK